MTDKPRAPRRRFDSSSLIPKSDDELPGDPLPAEPPPVEFDGPGADAPIVLLPIGSTDDRIVKGVVTPVAQAFGRDVVVTKPLPVPKYAFNPTRDQYHSAAILKRVEGVLKPNWEAAIGIASVDLFVPEVPFVFGEADRSTRSAVISVVRLKPEIGGDAKSDITIRRLISEVIHHLGLIRGLAHCPNNRCVMFMSTTVQDTDKKGTQFCANCRKRLVAESSS